MAHPLAGMKRGMANPPAGRGRKGGPKSNVETVSRMVLAARREFFGPEKRTVKECAAIARVPALTVHCWLSDGRQEIEAAWNACEAEGADWALWQERELSDVARFALEWDYTDAVSELSLVRQIREQGERAGHWPALAWLLERRHPEQYSRNQQVAVQASGEVTLRIVEKDGAAWQHGAIPGQFLPDAVKKALPAIESFAEEDS